MISRLHHASGSRPRPTPLQPDRFKAGVGRTFSSELNMYAHVLSIGKISLAFR